MEPIGETELSKIFQSPTNSKEMIRNVFNRRNISGEAYRMTVTPEIAAAWLDSNFGRNRRIDSAVVRHYAEQMRSGKWRYNGDTIKIDTDGNLQDGQHRLSACIVSGRPFDTLVVTGVPVESYITQNTGKPQQAGDVMRLNGVANYNGTAAAARAYIRIRSGEDGSPRKYKVSNEDVWEEYQSKRDLYDKAVSAANRCNGRNRAVKPSETAAAIVYLVTDKGYSVEVAVEFFEKVSDYRDVSDETCSTLRDFLRKNLESRRKYDEATIRKAWAYAFDKWSKEAVTRSFGRMMSSSIRDWRDVRPFSSAV